MFSLPSNVFACCKVAKGASLKVENLQSPSIGKCLNEGGQIFLGRSKNCTQNSLLVKEKNRQKPVVPRGFLFDP